ncbi:hypothetical protein Tco_1221502 [Tanacetum coccineum]
MLVQETQSSGFVSDNGNAHSLENDCSMTRNDQSSKKQSSTSGNESSRLGNKCSERSYFGDDTDIKPSYDTEPMAEVPYTAELNVFAAKTQHTEQPEFLNETSLMEKVDSNTTPNSSDMCNNELKYYQNADDHEVERVMLANLIANLKLDIDENKNIQKQLRKENASLAHELNRCKSDLEESNDIRDRCISSLHEQDIKLERYKKYENYQLEKEENEPPNPSSYYNGRASFVNPKYLKKAQSEKPCLHTVPFDKDDLANIFAPNSEETLILEKESRSKLDKELFTSQVVEKKDFTKPVTLHSWSQARQSVFAKPYHVNAKHVSFQSLEESVGSNDMVHNYYLEEAKKKAQLQKDKALNSKPSVITSAKLPNTANGSKPKPRNSYQQPRN